MFINKLRIFNNYRRFHDLTIELGENPKRIIALVGANGCGKSSIFDAMIYHSKAHTINIFGISNRNIGQDYHFMSGSEHNNYSSVEIIFNNGLSFNKVRELKGDLQQNNTIFSFRSSYRYNNFGSSG